MSNSLYLLAFNRMPGVGPKTALKLLSHFPQLDSLFALSYQDMLKEGLPERLAKTIKTFDLHAVEDDFRWAAHPNHTLLTLDDAAYPRLLKEIADPPLVIYARGDLSCLNAPTLAIIGSRNPSCAGAATAKHFAKVLSGLGVTIVSGLAMGIDAQSHQGCLEAEGKTIAVMGTGIDVIYPRKHQALAEKMTENGLLISEFPLKTQPVAGHFPRRNRIISGLSLAILVVEAAIKSGSLITARFGLEQNRDIFAIPGSIQNPLARGCHYLLQQGATLVTTPEEVLSELKLNPTHRSGLDRLDALPKAHQTLISAMTLDVVSIDELIVSTGLNLDALVCHLAELELKGLVAAAPGGYMRCSV